MYSQSPGEKSWNAFWWLQGVRHRDGGDQVGHFSSSQWQSKFRNYRILIQWSPILAIPLYSYVFFVWNSVCQEYRFCLYKTVSGTPSRRSQGKRPTASRSPDESFTEIEQYKYAYKIQICIQTRSSEKLFFLAAHLCFFYRNGTIKMFWPLDVKISIWIQTNSKPQQDYLKKISLNTHASNDSGATNLLSCDFFFSPRFFLFSPMCGRGQTMMRVFNSKLGGERQRQSKMQRQRQKNSKRQRQMMSGKGGWKGKPSTRSREPRKLGRR